MDNFDLKKYLAEGKLYEEAYNLPDSDSNTDRYVNNHWSSILKDILRAHTDLRNSKGGEGMPERPSQLDIDIVLGRFDGADEFMDVDPSVYDGDYFDFYDMYLVTQRDEENTKDISVEDYPEGDYSGYTKRDDLPNLAEGRLFEEEVDVNKILSDGGYDIIDDEELLMTVKARLKVYPYNIDAKKLNFLVMKIEDEEGGNIDFSEGKLNENVEEEIKTILTKSYPGAYSEEDFEEIINLYNTKYRDYKDSYGKLDGVEQAAFKFNYANNRDIMTGMKAGSKSSTSIDFPEMEDEFEGAMSSMSVSKEEYLQDIINASDDEIVSDDYFEIKNAVEQGVYSKDEAVKLAKEWARKKLK